MARNSGNQNNGNSKFKMLLIEGDMSEMNFSQLAQVVGQALRGPSLVRSVGAPAQPIRTISAPSVERIEDQDAEDFPDIEDVEVQPVKPSNGGPRKKKTYKAPVAQNFDMKTQTVPLAEFVKAKNNPQGNNKRFLVISSWLKDHAETPNVNINLVYTAYRLLQWPTNLPDWDQPFRELVKKEWMERVSPGEYTVAYLGQDQIDRMGGPVASEDAAD